MSLNRLDERRHLELDKAVWLICPQRNERALLPDFLRHYRSLGVRRFCFIDNDSNDGSRDYLLAQPDSVVFFTDESYRHSNFAADWINRLIEQLPLKGWIVVADADEHLCYEGMETRPIHALLHDCERVGADAVHAAMIDMYPPNDFLGLRVRPGERLLDLMPCFDTDYVFRRWPTRSGVKGLQVLGGPRCRLLSDLETERRRGLAFQIFVNQVDRFVEYVPLRLIPLLASIWPREVPAQIKTPINLVRPEFRFYNSHASSNSRFAPETAALLHFKFCSELQARFRMVLREGNHYRRGLSYLQLQNAIRRWGSTSLAYEGTRRFTGSWDLAQVGLVGPGPAVVARSGFTEEFHTGRVRRRVGRSGAGDAAAISRA